MTIRAWRIVQAKWAATAFSGEGARLYGGRWNSPGQPLVYVAEHPALAVLEVLVHLESEKLLTSAYVLIEVTFDDDLLDVFPLDQFPKDWAAEPPPASAQAWGDGWLANPTSRPAARVPSAVIPGAWNYLLNPRHPRFAGVAVAAPTPLKFDPRLKK